MPLEPEKLLGQSTVHGLRRYEDREVMLYALAVGARADELPFVYEESLTVIPSFAQMLAFDDSWLEFCGVELANVVHGALDITFHGTFAPTGEPEVQTRIAGLTDKGPGRGGIIHQEAQIALAGHPVATSLSSLFVRGGGGFGGDQGRRPDTNTVPDRSPDATTEVVTSANQAALFRLLGDRNPLHIDPAFARRAGFERPILHGAATFGLACLTVLRDHCAGDPARLKRFAARFAGPVFPGESLLFSFWRDAAGLCFRAASRERGSPVLDAGLAVIS